MRLCRDEKKIVVQKDNLNLRQEMPTRDEVKMQVGNVLKQGGSIGWQDGQWDWSSVTL